MWLELPITSRVLTDPSCFHESPSNWAAQVSGDHIALDLSWMSADVSINVPPTRNATQPRTLTPSWRWPETTVKGHPHPPSRDSDSRLAGYRNFPQVWSPWDHTMAGGGSLKVYKWSTDGGDLQGKKGWNYFTYNIQVQNWLRFSQQSHYVLNNCPIFNIVHELQGLRLVDASWQFLSGDIFSCHLWVLVISFVMCNILNSNKSTAQKRLIKAWEEWGK